jgi:hypothetical protein
MMKLLKDCFTTADGESFDIGRVLWPQGVLVYLALAVYSVVGQATPSTRRHSASGWGRPLPLAAPPCGLKAGTEPGGGT